MDPMGMLKKYRVKKSCFFYGDINLLYDLKIKPQNYSKYGGILLREQEMLLSLLPKKIDGVDAHCGIPVFHDWRIDWYPLVN